MEKYLRLLHASLKCGIEIIPHYYLRPYLPLAGGKDDTSRSLVRFKRRLQPDLYDWIESAVSALKSLRFSPDTVIFRPLAHEETAARPGFPGGLDLLGNALSTACGCQYLPSLLLKSRVTLPNKHLSRSSRRDELRNVYRIDAKFPGSTEFFLIDDILTTGTTMRALIGAIRRQHLFNPIRIFTLTLAANTV